MPSTVTNPTNEPSDKTPPCRNEPTTPPTNANGSVRNTSTANRHERKSTCNNKTMPIIAAAERASKLRCELRPAAYSPRLGVIPGWNSSRLTRCSISRAYGAQVTARHIARHVDSPRNGLAFDLVRRGSDEHIGHVTQRHLATERQIDRQVTDGRDRSDFGHLRSRQLRYSFDPGRLRPPWSL